ncbi:hypothetical protein EEL49_10970 [Muribaculaceae bacterium Isolate-104 (HZI)]|nr:hypothetical protein EEL49_10970 [Muribaculaceae bacterium Isolate-104 (HZI)]
MPPLSHPPLPGSIPIAPATPHFHIVYNRVNLHGKAIDESNNFDKSHNATKAIKLKYGLTFSQTS